MNCINQWKLLLYLHIGLTSHFDLGEVYDQSILHNKEWGLNDAMLQSVVAGGIEGLRVAKFSLLYSLQSVVLLNFLCALSSFYGHIRAQPTEEDTVKYYKRTKSFLFMNYTNYICSQCN